MKKIAHLHKQIFRITGCIILLTGLTFLSCKKETKTDTGDEVRVRIEAEPDRLNPMLTVSAYSLQVCNNIFPKLLDYDIESLELVPVLAKSRPAIKNLEEGPHAGGLAIEYEIRPEATWPNGEPVLASDYVFTLKTLFNPHVQAGPWRAYMSFIKEVTINKDNPRRFTVFTRNAYMLSEEASAFFIYPAYVYDPDQLLKDISLASLINGENIAPETDSVLQQFASAFNSPKYSREADHVVSCGPYQVQEWIPGQRLVLERKSNWWGDQVETDHHMLEAFPEKLVYLPIQDPNTALAALQDGGLDVVAPVPPQRFVDLMENENLTDKLEFYKPASLKYFYFGFNTRIDKLSDKSVRQALAHLVDTKQLIETVYDGLAKRIHGPIHPSKPYYHPDLKPIPFDFDKANKLLEEAGWEDSNGNGIRDKTINGILKELDLSILIASASVVGKNAALLLQQNARKAGVNITLETMEFSVLLEQVGRRDFDMYSLAAAQGLAPADPKQYWHRESDVPGGGNRTGFGSAKSDRLIDSIRSTRNEEIRHKLYLELQEIIYEEQPFIFLLTPLETIIIRQQFTPARISVKQPGYREASLIVQDAVN